MDRCCCPRNNSGMDDICKGINCIVGGIGKGICGGVNMLACMGNSLLAPARCCPPPKPCCRPRPHPPTCTCTCECRCR